jgi:exonuclease III
MCTYNILNAGGNRLNMALRAMAFMRVDLGLFQETKLSHDKFTHQCCGYQVCATRAKSSSQGGVALFYRESKNWTIEGVHFYGPNVMCCTLVSGFDKWSIIGMYIPPSEVDGSTLSMKPFEVHITISFFWATLMWTFDKLMTIVRKISLLH